MNSELSLADQILQTLPKSALGLNASVSDLLQTNQLLLQYFLKNELEKKTRHLD